MRNDSNFNAGFSATFGLNVLTFAVFSTLFVSLTKDWPLYAIILSSSTSFLTTVSVFATFRTVQGRASRLEEGGIFGEFPFLCSGLTAFFLWFFQFY